MGEYSGPIRHCIFCMDTLLRAEKPVLAGLGGGCLDGGVIATAIKTLSIPSADAHGGEDGCQEWHRCSSAGELGSWGDYRS